MIPIQITRYEPGGDLYEHYKLAYGADAADRIYAAARTGDRTRITDAIVAAKHGKNLTESTFAILGGQLYNDPLGAPLEHWGNVAKRSADAAKEAFLKVPAWVWLVALGGVALYLLGPKFRKLIAA